MSENTALHCANHPTVETALRCNRCEKPICSKCAIKSPVGYRCPECVKSQQKSFETAEGIDYILGFTVAGLLSGIGSFIISLLGMIGFFGFILVAAAAPVAGVVIAEAVRFAIRRHRSVQLFKVILAAIIIGALPLGLFQIFTFNIFGILFQAIYLFISVPTAYYRLSGIQLFK
ncbi:MAG: hypothetical protein NT121_19015 [Chloroflexi bacterium]|nr:hypothetical protein [Chloroflexota bacterium]